MAEGTAHTLADQILAAKYRIGGASITGAPAAPFYAQLHSADPGPNGTTAVINLNRRVAIGSMVSVGAGSGQVTNAADIVWLNVGDTKTVAAVSVWGGSGAATGPSGGTLMMTGAASGSYSIGDDATISAGDLVDAYIITG
jgi:hypothetical protein